MNIVKNAVIHGFEGRTTETLTIDTKMVDSQIQITIEDDGIEMTDKTLSKIFDPFFTTKMGRGGSGLGITVVMGGNFQTRRGGRFEMRMGGNVHANTHVMKNRKKEVSMALAYANEWPLPDVPSGCRGHTASIGRR